MERGRRITLMTFVIILAVILFFLLTSCKASKAAFDYSYAADSTDSALVRIQTVQPKVQRIETSPQEDMWVALMFFTFFSMMFYFFKPD